MAARPSKYPDEVRDQAVRMVFEWREARSVNRGGLKEVAAELGLNRETLRGWVKRVEVDTGRRRGTTTDDKARIAQLQRENRQLRRANETLKAASDFFRRELDPPSPN